MYTYVGSTVSYNGGDKQHVVVVRFEYMCNIVFVYISRSNYCTNVLLH